MSESLIIMLIAVFMDLVAGDPVYSLHPVRLIGKTIETVETVLFKSGFSGFCGGCLLAAALLILFVSLYTGLVLLAGKWHWIINLFLVYSCLALHDLLKQGRMVLKALETDNLEAARAAVQMLIGRDAMKLDSAGVARAAVESLAENFVDGFLSPLFWFVAAGVVGMAAGFNSVYCSVGGILVYRIVNTLDSMVGYRNEKYEYFGRPSARLDDVLNFLPARLSIPLITVAAWICRLNARDAWSIGWRDRLKHSSPNAGHSESCVAGALEIKLGGPGVYSFGAVEKPWLGNGSSNIAAWHLRRTIHLIGCASLLLVVWLAAILLIWR